MLRRANRLMESGRYAQAYPLLKRLADGAARHGMPVRAANLTLRAARARLAREAPEDYPLRQTGEGTVIGMPPKFVVRKPQKKRRRRR